MSLSPQKVHILITRIYEYVTLHCKTDLAGVIKLNTLRWVIISDYPGYLNITINIRVLIIGWQEGQSEKEMLGMKQRLEREGDTGKGMG